MQASTVMITPDLAAKFLEKNISNRKLQQRIVRDYAAEMLAGKWRLTHQGILFGKGGVLVDGQHRLNGIILAKVPVRMWVFKDDAIEGPLDLPIDMHLKRNATFVLGLPKHGLDVGRFLGEIVMRRTLSLHEVAFFAEQVLPHTTALYERHGSPSKIFTSAPCRSGAVLRLFEYAGVPEKTEMVISTFAALARHMPGEAGPYSQSFYGKVMRQPMVRMEIFSRAYRTFDYDRQQVEKATVKNINLLFQDACRAARKHLKPLEATSSLPQDDRVSKRVLHTRDKEGAVTDVDDPRFSKLAVEEVSEDELLKLLESSTSAQ